MLFYHLMIMEGHGQPPWPIHQCAKDRLGCKKCSKTNSFDKSGGDQHGSLDLTRSLGLTGDGIHGLATDPTDTQSSSDYDQTGTYNVWNSHDI